MAKVGGITCDIVRPNTPTGNKQRVETWTVPGLDGVGAHLLGDNDGEWEFTLVRFDTKINVFTWAQQIEALQGTIVTIIDDWVATYVGMLVTGVSSPARRPALHAKNLGLFGVRSTITISGRIT